MKYSKTILMVAALAAPISSAQAIETTIDFEVIEFDDLNFKERLLSEFRIEDVTIAGIGRTTDTGKFKFITSPSRLTPDTSGSILQSGANNFTGFKFSFDSAINSLSMNLVNNANDWELTAYDLTGTQIGLSTTASGLSYFGDNGGVPFSLSSESYNISYATLTNGGDALFGGLFEDIIYVDNLTYNTAVSPVPEPSTYALMLGGLGMVGFMAYRRRKATNA